MANASKLGIRIQEEKIRIQPETLKICKIYGIDPLQLIASGSLLIAADPHCAGKIIDSLREEQIDAEIIGEFLPSQKERVIRKLNGKAEKLPRPVTDQLWHALKKRKIRG
jgi:hydrogenase maturation factor